ncbi:MAG: extracellular solute-binding protein [Clostridia bacterium]|nr:extracellular solute-binding protein [Clostridia bacterium]
MKKQATLAALSVLLVLCAVSCGGGEGSTTAETTASVSADTTAAPVTEEKIDWSSAGIEAVDYGGKTFTVITEDIANYHYAWYRVAPDETDGEVLNDALVQRNQKIEETFNVDIIEIMSTGVTTDFRNAVTAGDASYDATLNCITHLFSMAQNGLLVNWYDLPNVNLDAQWWDQSVVSQLTVQDKLFFCTGDISPATNVRVYSLVFNKDLCRELGLDLPYDAVLNGKWTLDLFYQYIQDVNRDVNGDSVMDYEDRWGYFSQNGNSFMMYFAAGGKVVEIDDSGKMVLTMNSNSNIELATKALEISIDDNTTLMADDYVTQNGGLWSAASSWFAAGGSLMRSSVFEPVPRDYRSMDTDFGVLPYPKFDESQETYYTLAEEFSRMLAVPVTADTEFVGTMLEVLAAESVSTVSPAFYDVCLEGKSVRDEESAAVLDILFANKVFDYGLVADVAGFRSMMINLEKKDSTDVASSFASATKKAETSMKKITEALEGLD